MPIRFEEIPEPIGSFIIRQTDVKNTIGPNGTYWHYADVCTLLNRLKAELALAPIEDAEGWWKANKLEHEHASDGFYITKEQFDEFIDQKPRMISYVKVEAWDAPERTWLFVLDKDGEQYAYKEGESDRWKNKNGEEIRPTHFLKPISHLK